MTGQLGDELPVARRTGSPGAVAGRPRLQLYRQGQLSDISAEFDNLPEMFAASVERLPGQDAIRFSTGGSLSDLDRRSDALAAALQMEGFRSGDRLVVNRQNDLTSVVAMLATRKAGGILVTANPIYKACEPTFVIRDSGATRLFYVDDLREHVDAVLDEPSAVRIWRGTSYFLSVGGWWKSLAGITWARSRSLLRSFAFSGRLDSTSSISLNYTRRL